MTIKRSTLLLLVIVALLICACVPTAAAPPFNSQGTLTVAFLDVGQGDSTLIRSPNGTIMLIDGGRSVGLAQDVIIPQLQAWGADHVDVLIPTHPDADHISGLVGVLESYPVKLVVLTGQVHSTKIYERLLTDIRDQNIDALPVHTGTQIPFDPSVKLDVLGPDDRAVQADDTNNASIVIKLTYGQVSFLLTGDAEKPEEKDMLGHGADVRSTVLKLGHHGSRTSTDVEWLQEVSPQIGIISVGLNNSYGHPHPEVITALKQLSIPYYRTDEHGTIMITSDGAKYQITSQR